MFSSNCLNTWWDNSDSALFQFFFIIDLSLLLYMEYSFLFWLVWNLMYFLYSLFLCLMDFLKPSVNHGSLFLYLFLTLWIGKDSLNIFLSDSEIYWYARLKSEDNWISDHLIFLTASTYLSMFLLFFSSIYFSYMHHLCSLKCAQWNDLFGWSPKTDLDQPYKRALK